MKWIGVVGSRRRTSTPDFNEVRLRVKRVYVPGDMLVSGGCPTGADRFAEVIARQDQIPIMIHYARWVAFGRGAGYLRNGDIANQADILIACVAKDRTGGTEDTITKFLKRLQLTEEEAVAQGVLVLV